MTNEQLIELYNPTNAASLTPEQVTGLQNLSDAQICALAKAYPNKPRGNAYLVLYDKDMPMNKQLFTLSTWNNLCNLRSKMSKKNYVAYTFKALFIQTTGNNTQRAAAMPSQKEVVDISTSEAAKALQAAAEAIKIPSMEEKTGPAMTSTAVSPNPVKETAKKVTTPAPTKAPRLTAVPAQKPAEPQAAAPAGADDIPVTSPEEAEALANLAASAQAGGEKGTGK